MIDYEKIKYEIGRIHSMFYAEQASNNENIKALNILICNLLDNIYDSLTNLQDITVSKPKYKIGDVVYYLGGNNSINYLIVKEFKKGYTEDNYYGYLYKENNVFCKESSLYPSRESLIEAQTERWQNLKDELVTICHQLECEHESDWIMYAVGPDEPDGGRPIKDKCKKCGEFYK